MASAKENIVEFLIEDAAQKIIVNDDIEIDENEIEEILDDLGDNLSIVLAQRRGVLEAVPKSIHWRNNILVSLNEDRFKQMMRVGRQQFLQLVDMIKDDVLFNNAHSAKQFSVELQLAIVLFRLGSSGESASFRKIASVFGVRDGGTIINITRRVFAAILKLKCKYISWPSAIERSQIVADSFEELPFCIGYIDGTEIELAEAPIENHTAYFSRNHVYSLKAQVVCDYKKRIRHIVVGYPGSWHDSRIYKSSSIFKNPTQYFSSHQWIAGDSAYPLSESLITPYRNNATHLDKDSRVKFNLRHSSYRVRVEHCFGQLKEKFCSLKQLRMRIATDEDNKFCCDWIIVCCILHNFLKSTGQMSSEIAIDQENLEDIPDEEEETITSTAENKRQAIYSLMFS